VQFGHRVSRQCDTIGFGVQCHCILHCYLVGGECF